MLYAEENEIDKIAVVIWTIIDHFKETELHNNKRLQIFIDLKDFIKYHFKHNFGRATIIKYILKPTESPFKIYELKGLCKIYKPDSKMRIMFPLAGYLLSFIHKFIAKYLVPAVVEKKIVLTNIMEVID